MYDVPGDARDRLRPARWATEHDAGGEGEWTGMRRCRRVQVAHFESGGSYLVGRVVNTDVNNFVSHVCEMRCVRANRVRLTSKRRSNTGCVPRPTMKKWSQINEMIMIRFQFGL